MNQAWGIACVLTMMLVGTACDEDASPDAGDVPPADADVLDGRPDDGPDRPDAADVDGRPDGPVDDGSDDAAVDSDAADVGDTPDDGASGRVLPYDGCVGGDPGAKFLEESAPPDEVSMREEFRVSVTFANCCTETWTARGFRLGSQAPQNNIVWSATSVPLPGDVRPDEMVVIEFTVFAPDTIGRFGYQWGLEHVGVEWLVDEFSPLHTIVVAAPVETVELCPDILVELGGRTSATEALQQCIDATPTGGLLEIPAGVYLMTGAVRISRGIYLKTAGTTMSDAPCYWPGGPRCAVLHAAADLDVEDGFLQVLDSATGVNLEHLTLDGNRAARLGSAPATTCAAGDNRRGFNGFVRGNGHRFLLNASINALCGTALEWRGDAGTIMSNYFADNGDHATPNLWSDGLTILEASDTTVNGNLVYNSSDVGLIVGGGANSVVQGNMVVQSTQAAFAGIMLDNFNGATSGDFRGTLVVGNVVGCGPLLCDFGINLGPHAWYLSPNTLGGAVYANTVYDAKLCLNVDGAGTAAAPIAIHTNLVSGSPASAEFLCGVRPTSIYNIGPDSVVDRTLDTLPFTTYEWHVCP